jgi:hypothetical protein
MTPELAFSHPFISKAVNELKCLRTGSQGNQQLAVNGSANGGGGASSAKNSNPQQQ